MELRHAPYATATFPSARPDEIGRELRRGDGVMVRVMREIAPGLWHWTARHEHIGIDVSSYYLLPEHVLIDAMIPAEGLSWFDEHRAPEHMLLTNRHHDRHAWRLREAFGCTVHCVRNGLHELEGRGPVEAFDFGDELPGGAVAFEVDAICPDETALYIPAYRALACADGVVRRRGQEEPSFVPDHLMDAPEQTKAGLRDAYHRLLDLDFDLLLLAHGNPVVADGKEALRAFASSPPLGERKIRFAGLSEERGRSPSRLRRPLERGANASSSGAYRPRSTARAASSRSAVSTEGKSATERTPESVFGRRTSWRE